METPYSNQSSHFDSRPVSMSSVVMTARFTEVF